MIDADMKEKWPLTAGGGRDDLLMPRRHAHARLAPGNADDAASGYAGR